MSDSELIRLLDVQDLDLALDQQRHRRQTLPERAELARIETETAALQREADQVALAQDVVSRREADIEAELLATEERASTVSRRLYGGEVSASRELQAMAADVETLKKRASHLEDQALALLEEREPLDARAGDLGTQIGVLTGRRDDVRGRLEARELAVDAEIDGLTARRAAAAEGVAAELLGTYDHLRTRLAGVGAARLIGNHCDGCHLTLSSAELQRVRQLPVGEIVTCEQCGRILVPTPPAT